MKPETLEKLLILISRADRDELSIMAVAFKARYRKLSRQEAEEAIVTLRVGDTVVLRGFKPQYLNGTMGIIEARRGQKFVVRLEPRADPRAIKRFGPKPVCPASGLKKVDAHDPDA